VLYERNKSLNTRYISDFEITQHQQTIRQAARQARHDSTLTNIRQVMGSMLIAIGIYLQGSMEKRPTATIGAPAASNVRSI